MDFDLRRNDCISAALIGLDFSGRLPGSQCLDSEARMATPGRDAVFVNAFHGAAPAANGSLRQRTPLPQRSNTRMGTVRIRVF